MFPAVCWMPRSSAGLRRRPLGKRGLRAELLQGAACGSGVGNLRPRVGREPSLGFVGTAFCQNQKNQNKVPAVGRRPCQGSGVAWGAWGNQKEHEFGYRVGTAVPGWVSRRVPPGHSLTHSSQWAHGASSVIRTPFYTRRKPGLERSRHWPKVTAIAREEARTQPWSFILKIVALMPPTPS